jgi:hypothetical protein
MGRSHRIFIVERGFITTSAVNRVRHSVSKGAISGG